MGPSWFPGVGGPLMTERLGGREWNMESRLKRGLWGIAELFRLSIYLVERWGGAVGRLCVPTNTVAERHCEPKPLITTQLA